MENIDKNIEDYNPNKKQKMLNVFDDMIADMLNNKRLNPIVIELFIRGRNQTKFEKRHQTKFYTLFCYKNSKKELQQTVSQHSIDIDFQDLQIFM